jgi:hypothetical protein
MSGSDAQAGFYYQNNVAAQYALDLIEFGSQLRSITLENPQRATYIDDIILDSVDRSTFIQVKWAKDDNAAITLHYLVAADDGTNSLMEKLVRGFRQVSNQAGRKEIVLLTTRKPGTSRQPAMGFNKSLDEFLKEFHAPFIADERFDDIRQVPRFAEYEPILNRLLSASGLGDLRRFSSFLRCLRFKLSQPNRETVAERVRTRLASLGIEASQYGNLLDQVVNWSIAGNPVDRDEVLLKLGLHDHFVDRLSHSFPVDRQQWVETSSVFQALDDALGALDSGFILVEGEKGIGKSTALTMYQAHRPEVRFGYYCFVPKDRTLGNDRLEGDSFVRSICIGLRNAFPDAEFPRSYAPYTRDLLNQWFHALSKQGRRVVFVVDGVDQVDTKTRQSLVAQPLTSVLDGALPNNVLIVLSSLYLDALPLALRQHVLSEARRHIRMERFGRGQVQEFLRLRGASVADEDLDAAVERSGGLPIYLEYLAQRLQGMTRYEQKKFLEEVPSLRGQRIDSYHQYLWDACSDSDTIVLVLAILAVREEFTTYEDLCEIVRMLGAGATLASIHSAVGRIKHALRVSEGRSVAIRHNSFREFVADHTEHLRREINQVLVQWYAQNENRDEAWRHRFRHLFELGDYSGVLSACDDEWLARSWADHRPFPEIQMNLDIAWRAATAKRDVVEYVRIALLKQQVTLVARNLDTSEAGMACLLLDIGRPDEALRRVWDGEARRSDSIEFASFCLHHAKRCNGRVPPLYILKAGLGDPPGSVSPRELKTWYRARVYEADAVELVSEIDAICWTIKPSFGLLRSPAEENESRHLNLELQLAVVRQLVERRKIDGLQRLQSSDSVPPVVKTAARAATVLVFARVDERGQAEAELAGLDVSSIPTETRRWFVVELAKHGIEPLSAIDQEVCPELPVQFLGAREHELNDELFSLYDQLRVFFLRDETGYPWLEASTANIGEPLRSFVLAIGRLAQTWCAGVRGRTDTATRLSELQEVAAALDIRRDQFDGLDSAANLGELVYRGAAHSFYDSLWRCAVQFLPHSELEELAVWWARADRGRRPSIYARATRELAIAVNSRLGTVGKSTVRELLEVCESNARTDEETSAIASELLECAAAWACCGFAAESERLWRELLELACGVYWRKDYQFNEILTALKLAHEQEPDSTPTRIREQLVLAHQLVGPAQGRTVEVAIEELIAFAAETFPCLALFLLEREGPHIYRPRALYHVVRALLRVEGIDLRWVLTLVATMERWTGRSDYEEHTKPAMSAVYTSALKRQHYDIARRAYDLARHVFLVEQESPSDIGNWAAAWADAGNAPMEVVRDYAEFGTEMVMENEPLLSGEPIGYADWAELDALASKGLAELEQHLDRAAEEGIARERRSELERVYPDWLTVIQKAIGTELSEEKCKVVDCLFGQLATEVCTVPAESGSAPRRAVREALRRFVESCAQQLSDNLTIEQFGAFFDIEMWLDSFAHKGTFYDRGIEKRIGVWIEAGPLSKVDEWEAFCRRRCRGESLAVGLLAVARRLVKVDPPRAIDLLIDGWKSCSEFLNERLANQILSELMRLDRERGCDLLFESFRQQYQRYPEAILDRIERLLAFSSNFPTFDAVRLYEVWSGYNKRLVAGLSAKPLDTRWPADEVAGEFRDHCLRYLIGLFDYPVVDVRRLALEELYRLLEEQCELVRDVLNLWYSLSSGQKEHVTSLLFSVGIAHPASAHTWAVRLVELGKNEEHYNLRSTIAEAIVTAVDRGAHLDADVVAQARALKSPPAIMAPSLPSLYQGLRQTVRYPSYLRWAIDLLGEAAAPGVLEARTRSTLVMSYSHADQGLQEEAAVHRRHNINDNFDVIEISGEYDRAVREAANFALYALVQEHSLNEAELENTSDVLRVCDPSDVLVRAVPRPSNVSWIDSELSDDDFVQYADIDRVKDLFLHRDEQWVTLYENTQQRIGDAFGASQKRASKVRAIVFGLTHGCKAPTLTEIEHELRRGALAPGRNRYRFELARLESRPRPSSPNLRRKLVPIVRVSRRSFRGRHSPDLAAILPELASHLRLQPSAEDILGYKLGSKSVVHSIDWQEAFDDDRRLHEPKSSGFLLQIDRELLLGWAHATGLQLWAYLLIERTTDRYKPEAQMDWQTYSFAFEMQR